MKVMRPLSFWGFTFCRSPLKSRSGNAEAELVLDSFGMCQPSSCTRWESLRDGFSRHMSVCPCILEKWSETQWWTSTVNPQQTNCSISLWLENAQVRSGRVSAVANMNGTKWKWVEFASTPCDLVHQFLSCQDTLSNSHAPQLTWHPGHSNLKASCILTW